MSSEQSSSSTVTRVLACYVTEAKPDALPDAVRNEAARTFLNWLGCAMGGARHETLEIAIAALTPFSGPPQASILEHRFRGLTTGIIGQNKTAQLIDLCWKIDELETVADIAKATRA